MKEVKKYLIGVSFTTRGYAMEYKLVERKEDLRTRFCKRNKNNTISNCEMLTSLCEKHHAKLIPTNGFLRILFPNGKEAYDFAREIGRI